MNTDHQYGNSSKLILWVTYVLQLLVVPAVFGAVINALQLRHYRNLDVKPNATDTLVVSHHQWLLRTFLITLFFIAMAAGTLYYGVGYLVGTGVVVWWIYRMVRGLISCAENKPMPV